VALSLGERVVCTNEHHCEITNKDDGEQVVAVSKYTITKGVRGVVNVFNKQLVVEFDEPLAPVAFDGDEGCEGPLVLEYIDDENPHWGVLGN
jgi:hypothetical protein